MPGKLCFVQKGMQKNALKGLNLVLTLKHWQRKNLLIEIQPREEAEWSRLGRRELWEKTVANLKTGELSKIIKTDSGYHILKLEKRIPKSTKKFSELKDDLEKLVTVQKIQTRLNPWLINLAESANIKRNLPE